MSGFDLQLHAALRGDYEKEIEGGLHHVSVSLRYALTEAGTNWRDKFRADLQASGLARAAELSKTWRLKVYPRAGVNTLSPAVEIVSTMPKVIAAFEEGATIVVHGKRGALVPNPEVWGERRVRRPAGRGAKAETTFKLAERAFGKLQFIKTRSRGGGKLIGAFIADVEHSREASRRRRSAGVRGRLGRAGQVVVFWVLKDPKLPRLLHGQTIRARFYASAPAEVNAHFVVGFNRGPDRALLEGPA